MTIKEQFDTIRNGVAVTGKEGDITKAAIDLAERVVTDLHRLAEAMERIARATEVFAIGQHGVDPGDGATAEDAVREIGQDHR